MIASPGSVQTVLHWEVSVQGTCPSDSLHWQCSGKFASHSPQFFNAVAWGSASPVVTDYIIFGFTVTVSLLGFFLVDCWCILVCLIFTGLCFPLAGRWEFLFMDLYWLCETPFLVLRVWCHFIFSTTITKSAGFCPCSACDRAVVANARNAKSLGFLEEPISCDCATCGFWTYWSGEDCGTRFSV